MTDTPVDLSGNEHDMTVPSDDTASPRQPDSTTPEDEVPEIEDAYTTDAAADGDVGEDDPQLLEATTRSLELEMGTEENGTIRSENEVSRKTAESDDSGDAAGIEDELTDDGSETGKPELPDWNNELSTRRIALELKRIETEIRLLLQDRDPKRKRKLGGTRRWYELEEDIISWRHTGRFGEPLLLDLSQLITQRHYLFRRLRFLAGTRPTWNT